MSRRSLALSAVAVLTLGCADEKPAPTGLEFSTPLFITVGRNPFNFGTNMRGEQEVFTPANPGDPTPADSRAAGQANFRVSDDGSRVRFVLLAEHIDNIIMAHVHCGVRGANGPIRMWLYPVVGTSGAPAPAGAGAFSGRLAEGTFDPSGVICPASAVGVDMPLLDAMRQGLAYVNVHTNDGVAPTNTGPGDFPGGEIRGQLRNVVAH